ncbi:hypothetical protein [Bacillus thuringiensis]|uniref:hypothetical protein n=1 Tax=Bacillus thuringiensis TaxID=1428 RepID=UPI000BFCA8C5|nr:hypothetical protein [Bacillus thuringiensis]PGK77781.1 hypothetical protein CN928_10900 [Bacillus thuringiensis]
MLCSIFFDQNNNFQWAAIATFVSLGAIFLNGISLWVTSNQAKQNRKSSTLVSLRIEELKDMRKESVLVISAARAFVEQHVFSEIHIDDLMKHKNDAKLREYVKQFSGLLSILYRNTSHAEKFLDKVDELDRELLKIKTVYELGDWAQEFEFAVKEYSKIEYKEIEDSI